MHSSSDLTGEKTTQRAERCVICMAILTPISSSRSVRTPAIRSCPTELPQQREEGKKNNKKTIRSEDCSLQLLFFTPRPQLLQFSLQSHSICTLVFDSLQPCAPGFLLQDTRFTPNFLWMLKDHGIQTRPWGSGKRNKKQTNKPDWLHFFLSVDLLLFNCSENILSVG